MDPKIKLKKKYMPLFAGETRYTIVVGGRGSGKSFGVGSCLIFLTFEEKQKVLFTRYTLTSAKTSIIPEFNEKIEILEAHDKFEVTNDEVVNRGTKSSILFKGIKTSSGNQTANLKSLQGVTAWVNDESEELTDEETFDKIDLSIRQKGVTNRVILVLNPAKKAHWIYKRFFEPHNIPDEFNGVVDGVTYIHTTYLDNLENLDESFIEQVEKLKRTNLKKYNHVVLGHWADANEEDALWTDEVLNLHRVQQAPNLRRIVVAIDPAVTSKDTSDETGIIVAGIGIDGHLYVLEDRTAIYTPTNWAMQAVALYEKYKADRIIGEVNNGGDLIETVLRTVNPNIPYRGVHATRDKFTRAEPVAALYEQGKAHHVGHLSKLEYEQTTWEAKKGEQSPNRIDALVWGAFELGFAKQQQMQSNFLNR